MLTDKHQYLRKHCQALFKTAEQGDPWVFLCASVYIEYLAKMTINDNESYVAFIKKFLSQIDTRYSYFKYKSEKNDLPEQMFYILRNGLVHSFTLKPNKENDGRINSILLSHNDPHFQHRTDKGLDGCVFNAYNFVSDLCKVTDLIFELSKTDKGLFETINAYWKKHPPLDVL